MRRASIESLNPKERNQETKTSTILTDPESVLKLVQPFFPKEWGRIRPQDVTLRKLTGGFCSSITLATRYQPTNELAKEPLSLLIKMKGGNMVDTDDFAINTDSTIKIIAYEMGRRGLGPKVYGIFNGGSVEEYIDSHTLTYEESADPAISKDIACALAAIHSIQELPLKMTAMEENFAKQRQWIKMIPEKGIVLREHEAMKNYGHIDIDFLMNFDYRGNTDWLLTIFDQVSMRKNFILNDTNFLNCLVRNAVKDGQSRVVLIDYDVAYFGYRGVDLGGHFFARRFRGDSKDKIVPESVFFTVEQKRNFLHNYQQEIQRLNLWNDFDACGIDSIENLYLECLIGQCINILFFGSYMMAKAEMILNFDHTIIPCIELYFSYFLCLKDEIENILKQKK